MLPPIRSSLLFIHLGKAVFQIFIEAPAALEEFGVEVSRAQVLYQMKLLTEKLSELLEITVEQDLVFRLQNSFKAL